MAKRNTRATRKKGGQRRKAGITPRARITPADARERRPAPRRFGADLAGKDDNVTLTFADFFADVAKGIVEGQKRLDGLSAEYLNTARRQPHVLPSVFKIPKVSADARYAIEKGTSTSVNLVFVKETNEAKTRHQQGVQFDVVAVPPPPELQALPFQVPLVIDRQLRDQVLKAVTSPKPDWPDALAVLIFNLAAEHYLLVYAGKEDAEVGIRDVRTPGGTPESAVVRALTPVSAALKPLAQVLRDLGAAQRRFLEAP
jgi:hypothetical protein